MSEHADVARSDSFYADLRRGVGYAFARRVKALSFVAAAAAYLISNGLVHGTAETVTNVVISVVGFLLVHQLPNARPVAKGPKPHERATERGLSEPVVQPADDASLAAEDQWPDGKPVDGV